MLNEQGKWRERLIGSRMTGKGVVRKARGWRDQAERKMDSWAWTAGW